MILKWNSTFVCECHTPLTARSHTKPPPSLGPVPCSRTTGSVVTWLYSMEANCPETSHTSLWRRMMFPTLWQMRTWSSEKRFPQQSHTPGRANRGLLYCKARPSLNSRAERTVSFFSLGMADSHAPVEKSFAFLRLRCFRSSRAGMLASNILKDSSWRLDRASARVLKKDRVTVGCDVKFFSASERKCQACRGLTRHFIRFGRTQGLAIPSPASLTGRSSRAYFTAKQLWQKKKKLRDCLLQWRKSWSSGTTRWM